MSRQNESYTVLFALRSGYPHSLGRTHVIPVAASSNGRHSQGASCTPPPGPRPDWAGRAGSFPTARIPLAEWLYGASFATVHSQGCGR